MLPVLMKRQTLKLGILSARQSGKGRQVVGHYAFEIRDMIGM